MKITPAASDSPAEAMVCTMLFSRMFELRQSRSTAIEITAAGIDAATVSPANIPRYALAPASKADSTRPSTIALTVSCGSGVVAFTLSSLLLRGETAQRFRKQQQHQPAADGDQHDLRVLPGPSLERPRYRTSPR